MSSGRALFVTALLLLEMAMGFTPTNSRVGGIVKSSSPRNLSPFASQPIRTPLEAKLSSSALFGANVATKGMELAGLFYDDTSLAFDAWYVWIASHCKTMGFRYSYTIDSRYLVGNGRLVLVHRLL